MELSPAISGRTRLQDDAHRLEDKRGELVEEDEFAVSLLEVVEIQLQILHFFIFNPLSDINFV